MDIASHVWNIHSYSASDVDCGYQISPQGQNKETNFRFVGLFCLKHRNAQNIKLPTLLGSWNCV